MRTSPQRIWVRYLFGLSLIFIVLVISHHNSLSVISSGRGHARLINLSGQQRTLSQQLLILTDRYFINQTPQDQAILSAYANSFFEAHKKLSGHNFESDELRKLYFGTDKAQRLDAEARKFIAKVYIILAGPVGSQKSINAYNYIKNFAPEILLGKLNKAVGYFEIEAENHVDHLVFNQILSLTAALSLLIIEFFIIFLPIQNSVIRSISRLERHKKSLRSARSELAAKNEELNQSFEKMEHAALHDTLTGLANRRYLEQEIDNRIKLYAKKNGTMAVLHIDLDNFKIVNDTFGHAAGDYILKKVATIFRSNARDSDFIARIGGDEFVLVSYDRVCEKSAANIAERILRAFEKPIKFNGQDLNISVSIGIDVFQPQEKTDDNCVSQILRSADVALYLAKENGRNRFEIF